MEDVLPSHLRSRAMGPGHIAARRFFGLYAGDVLAIIEPDSKASLTKKFREYRVAAAVYLDGIQATVEFPHAILANPLASLADGATWTLRADGKALQKGVPGTGSKVLVQCINGDPNNAVIVSGYRSDKDADEPAEKAGDLAFAWEYNGIRVTVDADGELVLTRRGPTLATGEPDEDRVPADQVGATVTLEAAGGIRLATTRPDDQGEAQDEQVVHLDQESSTLTVSTKSGLSIEVVEGPADVKAKDDVTVISTDGDVTATAEKGDVTLQAPKGKVHLGRDASEKAVLGDQLKGWLNDLCSAIQQLSVGTGVGPSSPPINAAAFAQLASKLDTLLSTAVDVAKQP